MNTCKMEDNRRNRWGGPLRGVFDAFQWFTLGLLVYLEGPHIWSCTIHGINHATYIALAYLSCVAAAFFSFLT